MHGKELLHCVVGAAALTHDPGKATTWFMDKVWKGQKIADPIRHEIISKFMLERYVHSGRNDPAKALLSDIRIDRTIAADSGKTTALAAASWLVMTHHRLPAAAVKLLSSPSPVPHEYTLINHATEPTGGTISVDPRLADPMFLDALSSLDANSLARELNPALFSAVCSYGRLALILADHKVSSQPFDPEWHNGKRMPKGSLVANTERIEKKIVAKQGLVEHLIKCFREASLTVDDVLDAPTLVPSLKTSDLPAVFRDPSAGRFSWQNGAVEAIAARKADGMMDGGFFAVLAAGTGTGKTIGTAKIMSALGDIVRYSACLPLRSLTRQTGIDYRKDLGLKSQDVTTIIGGSVIDLDDECAMYGSGDPAPTRDKAEETPLEVDNADAGHVLHDRIARHMKDDPAIHALVSSPILVCTIDHLASLTDMRRSQFVIAALRLLTSDLVIDEADSYDDNDLVALGRLVFIAGMFGRRVVLSSATLPAPIARAYLKAYRDGYAAHAALFGKENNVQLGLFSDSVPCRIVTADGGDDGEIISSYLDSVGKSALKSKPVRIARFMQRETARSSEALFPAVVDELVHLHEHHGQLHPDHGKTLSVQLVRFSHVNPCIALAQHIEANQPGDYDIRYVVYHSRFPRSARDIIEQFLEKTLKRKDQDKALLSSPTVNTALSECRKRGVIIVVIATAVLEIGRDVDFDAAVVEPCSVHSLIQVSGRVGRHRMFPATCANVIIMPTSMRRIDQRWEMDFTFTRPGAEGEGVDGERYRLESVYAEDAMPPSPFPVTAAMRLDADNKCKMSDLEHRRLAGAMLGSGPALLAMTCSNEHRLWMTDHPAKTHKFRDAEPTLRVFFDTGNFKFYDSVGGDISGRIVYRDTRPRYALLNLRPDADDTRLPVDLPQRLFDHGMLCYMPALGVVAAENVREEHADA